MAANAVIFYVLLAIGGAIEASSQPTEVRRVEDSVSLLQARVGSGARARAKSRSSLGGPSKEEVEATIFSDWGAGLKVEVLQAFEGGLTTGARGHGFAAKVQGKTLPRGWKDPKAPFVIKKVRGDKNMKGMKKEVKVLMAVSGERTGFPKIIKYEVFEPKKGSSSPGFSYLAQTLAPGLPEMEIEATASDWPVATARRCVKEIVKAMHALHKQGWAHADHNRANMMIDDRGSVTLLDFDQAVEMGQQTDQNTFETGVLADLQYIFAVAGRLGLKITEEPLEPDEDRARERLERLRGEAGEKEQELPQLEQELQAAQKLDRDLLFDFSATEKMKSDSKEEIHKLRQKIDQCKESRDAINLAIQEIVAPSDAEWSKAGTWAYAASAKASPQKPITKYDEAILRNVFSFEEALLALLDGRLPSPSVTAITGKYPLREDFEKKSKKKESKKSGKKGNK